MLSEFSTNGKPGLKPAMSSTLVAGNYVYIGSFLAQPPFFTPEDYSYNTVRERSMLAGKFRDTGPPSDSARMRPRRILRYGRGKARSTCAHAVCEGWS